MDKRYQVFVSSTFVDLEEERQEVMHALLELDCLPAGMELFPAANETQWDLIKRVIDDSDYYVLILGGRYGSVGPEGLSYTEMEYRYALETGKPTIAFYHRDPSNIIASKTESTDEGKAKLAKFRELVQKKLCKPWDTPQELGSVVSRSLIQLIKTTPAVGWVRGNEVPDRDAALELLSLRRRVEELQEELRINRTKAPEGARGLAHGDEPYSVDYTFDSKDEDWDRFSYDASVEFTWDEIFSAVAPHMIHEAEDRVIKGALDQLVRERTLPMWRDQKRLEGHEIGGFRVNLDAFQTIKVQLRALGLIVKSEKNRSVKDAGTYWTLTPYGDDVMTQLRAIRSANRDALQIGHSEPPF